jgi:hypothetical protein
MTLIVASVWGGRVSMVADRLISRGTPSAVRPVDEEAAKLLAVVCGDALFGIGYTGVAVADGTWMDQAIASCLAARKIKPAMIQPGSFFLSRPLHELLRNLAFNLPIQLRKQQGAKSSGLKLAIAGWHLRPRLRSFICELVLKSNSLSVGGTMQVTWHPVAKHFRNNPQGLWIQAWGDEDAEFESRLRALGDTQGFTHDDVEKHIVEAVVQRGHRTPTVGDQCIALQIDPMRPEANLQYTYYPGATSQDPHTFLSGWVLAPTSINSPTKANTLGASYSECGSYAVGGFSDPNSGLSVRTRLPTSAMSLGGPTVLSYRAQQRTKPPP